MLWFRFHRPPSDIADFRCFPVPFFEMEFATQPIWNRSYKSQRSIQNFWPLFLGRIHPRECACQVWSRFDLYLGFSSAKTSQIRLFLAIFDLNLVPYRFCPLGKGDLNWHNFWSSKAFRTKFWPAVHCLDLDKMTSKWRHDDVTWRHKTKKTCFTETERYRIFFCFTRILVGTVHSGPNLMIIQSRQV